MPSTQDIMTDVDLRYRNTFTVSQKLVWFNEEQLELFDVLEIDSDPYAFVTVVGENFYPLPDQFDVTKIKVVTMQDDDTIEPKYIEVQNKRNGVSIDAPYGAWYSIVSNALYLSYPGGVRANRNVYIYCDSEPTEVTTANLSSSPDLPTKYQEILKLGILKRIAMARKDVLMYNNYTGDYEQKITDALLAKKLKEPEWVTPADVMPRIESNIPYTMNYGFPFWRQN